MWKAEREAGMERGKAGPKDTSGRLRGRQERKRGNKSKRDIRKAVKEGRQ
jgi:hypothetical protein